MWALGNIYVKVSFLHTTNFNLLVQFVDNFTLFLNSHVNLMAKNLRLFNGINDENRIESTVGNGSNDETSFRFTTTYLYWGFLSNLHPTDCAPMGLMQSWVRAHCTQGNMMFVWTVSTLIMKSASPFTIWRNKKFSASVWKYSNIFLCVKLETGFMRSNGQAKKPFFLARLS